MSTPANLLKSQHIDDLMKIVFKKTGIDLTGYRKSMLSSRISQQLSTLGMPPEQYLSLCCQKTDECRELVNAIAINVSLFFRNSIVFEIISQTVIPSLLLKNERELRVWSAGCAAGEEAYSIAILFQEELKKLKSSVFKSLIFATDIDKKIVEKAKDAFYPRESLEDTKLRIIDSYFHPTRNGFELCSAVKNMVNFSVNDLLSSRTIAPADSIYGGFDIILCRNVLIYFSDKHQEQIQKKLYESLASGGYLILGDSETICQNLKSRFKMIDARNKIFQK